MPLFRSLRVAGVARLLYPAGGGPSSVYAANDLQRRAANGDCPSCDLRGADLSGRRLVAIDLSGADLRGARITSARLQGARLGKAHLQQAKRSGNLVGTDFTGAQLHRADLTGANLKEARFRDADLRRAGFSGCNLYGTDFTAARLHRANLREAVFDGANVDSAVFADALGVPELIEPCDSPETDRSSDLGRRYFVITSGPIRVVGSQVETIGT